MDFKSFDERRVFLIKETKRKISESIKDDTLITQAINAVSEIDKAVNVLAKRLREWYELYNPEMSKRYPDHEIFIKKILMYEKREVESMGSELAEKDLAPIIELTEKIEGLYDQKERYIDYIKIKMETFCPCILEITGPLIGAKLIAHKGTLKELAFMPSSTIQLLGAEKALFRHLKSNAKSPKYGYILQHQEVSQAKNKGRAARQLANKISLAAKKDYFRGGSEE